MWSLGENYTILPTTTAFRKLSILWMFSLVLSLTIWMQIAFITFHILGAPEPSFAPPENRENQSTQQISICIQSYRSKYCISRPFLKISQWCPVSKATPYQYKHQNPRFNRLRPHTIDSNVLILGPVKHSSVKSISC